MPKSYGLEYFVIIAAMAASLSVPVLANSLVSITSVDADTTPASTPSTVHTLGTLRADEVQNLQAAPNAANEDQDTGDSLQPVEINGIKFVTGGIGDEERAALDSMKHDFNVHIVSAGAHGEFVGNTRVIIRDSKGNELLNTSAGPMFYAKLPPGTYTIDARSGGEEQSRRVVTGNNKPLFVHFTWR
jgi:hypothetical protein